MAQMVKHLPAMWRTRVQSWVGKIPWRRKWLTHSSILAWKTPWTEEPGGLHIPWGCKESDTTERLHFSLSREAGVSVGADVTMGAEVREAGWFEDDALLVLKMQEGAQS